MVEPARLAYGSVCSGIEAASVAWEPLGFEPLWFSEIEKFPSKVLRHHWPHVPNMGDMRALPVLIELGVVPAPDVLVGGTPCQSFSVAGLRKGLSDARGNLTLTYIEIANAIDEERARDGKEPCITVWENVPGVLSSKDNAFGCFLAGLVGETDALQPSGRKWANAGVVLGPQRAAAWRVLDAQYFGLAQRRKRVFVVSSARHDFDPGEVLLEFEGVRRDSAPSREAQQNPTAGSGASLAFGGWPVDVTATLTAAFGIKLGTENQHVDGGCPFFVPEPLGFGTTQVTSPGNYSSPKPGDPSHPLTAHGHAPAIAFALRGRETGAMPEVSGDVVNAIRASSGGSSRDYIAFSRKDCGADAAVDLAPTLRAMGHSGSHANAGGQLAVVHGTQDPCVQYDLAFGLGRNNGGENALCATGISYFHRVRRLMPVECERLQGFPDGHTDLGPGTPDGPRYKALGNSKAVPVVRWIGRRIQRALAIADLFR